MLACSFRSAEPALHWTSTTIAEWSGLWPLLATCSWDHSRIFYPSSLLCCNQMEAGEEHVCWQWGSLSLAEAACPQKQTSWAPQRGWTLGAVSVISIPLPLLKFCHSLPCCLSSKFSHLAFLPWFLTIFSSWRQHPEGLRIRSGDCPDSYSLFI